MFGILADGLKRLKSGNGGVGKVKMSIKGESSCLECSATAAQESKMTRRKRRPFWTHSERKVTKNAHQTKRRGPSLTAKISLMSMSGGSLLGPVGARALIVREPLPPEPATVKTKLWRKSPETVLAPKRATSPRVMLFGMRETGRSGMSTHNSELVRFVPLLKAFRATSTNSTKQEKRYCN